jgi:hypothetical protein
MNFYLAGTHKEVKGSTLIPLEADFSKSYFLSLKYMVKKCYTVVLQSTIPNAATTQFESFFYDWSQIDEGQYQVTFAFMSGQGTAPTNLYAVNVYVDLGQGAYTQVASSANTATTGQVYSPSYLGTLEYGYIGTNAPSSLTYFFARPNSNVPIYLEQRPRNNLITVSLYTNVTSQIGTPAVLPGPYTLTLSLQQL